MSSRFDLYKKAIRNQLQLDQRLGKIFDVLAENDIKWALRLVVFAVFFSGTIYSFVEEDISMPDGWWWAVVTMSTVGYGDISPKTTGIRVLATFTIAAGIVFVAIITSALAGRVAARRIQKNIDAERVDDDIEASASELRDLADKIEALAPIVRKVHDEEADDHEHWQGVVRVAESLEWTVESSPRVNELIKELRLLAAAEGVTVEGKAK